jgi:2-amino-4-hydroxy-6-hydroxymethyldihydropteridine diphosphokinase
MARALVALGSNVGDRASQLRDAVARLEATRDLQVVQVSAWNEYPPIGGPSEQPVYLNGAVLLETSLEPERLLSRMLQIEDELGRQRDVRWDRRTIDLDLLLYDSLVVRSPNLELPHPRLAVRRFVLEPAAKIAGAMIHPTIGWSIDRLLEHLRRAVPYAAITGQPGVGKSQLARDVAKRVGGRYVESPPQLQGAADRPGSDLDVEIEFLRARKKLLASQNWNAFGSWMVSDFWLGQSLAYAKARLTSEAARSVELEVSGAETSFPPPKLTVLLPAPFASADDRGRRLEVELEAAFQVADLGPVLRLPAGDLPRAELELAAALEGMR